jgi:hypothetical protein
VTCIARQQTDKHLETEYTHATIELRMLLLVARQQSAPMKSLSGNNVAGCLAMTQINIRSQQYGKRLFSMRSVPRLYHPRYKYNRRSSREETDTRSSRQEPDTGSSRAGDRHG